MIPDISQCSGLERLTLKGCHRLKRIESFIGILWSLVELKIENCKDLAYLPQEIGALVKLKHFSLSACYHLRELPSSIENLTSLTELDISNINISGMMIQELPKSIGKLKSLRILRILRLVELPFRCGELDWQFPSGISMLVNLEELEISGHRRMSGKIPIGIGELSSLRILNLSHTGICEIPTTIKMLHRLQRLDLGHCDAIQELPELPPNLTSLCLISGSLRSVPNPANLTNLVELELGDGFLDAGKSSTITGGNLRWIGKLSRLKRLHLDLQVPAPPELASLSHLEELTLHGADREALKQLLRNLSTLRLVRCEVEDISSDVLQQIENLTIDCCDRIQRLSIPSELRKLRCVRVTRCKELVETRVVGLLKSLESFSIDQCKSLTRISGLSHLKNLESLGIYWCFALTDVEGLDELESLKRLYIWDCTSLRRWIDASCTKIPDDCHVCLVGCGDPIGDFIWVMYLKDYRRKILQNSTKKGKRKGDHASHTNTTTKNHTCGQQSGIPQRVTRSRAAKVQPPVEAAILSVEVGGPSRKKKKNDSGQVNPVRRSVRLMEGPT